MMRRAIGRRTVPRTARLFGPENRQQAGVGVAEASAGTAKAEAAPVGMAKAEGFAGDGAAGAPDACSTTANSAS